jgi:hypothetical protein
MFKYLITYYIEKLHRYCFDHIYLQDHKTTNYDKMFIWLLNFCQKTVPDYREYLKQWHKDSNSKYNRYKSY